MPGEWLIDWLKKGAEKMGYSQLVLHACVYMNSRLFKSKYLNVLWKQNQLLPLEILKSDIANYHISYVAQSSVFCVVLCRSVPLLVFSWAFFWAGGGVIRHFIICPSNYGIYWIPLNVRRPKTHIAAHCRPWWWIWVSLLRWGLSGHNAESLTEDYCE